jgi:tRNA U34 5-carboxymethylaminomethyl modifying GTPase MnmE/TrmE
MSDRLTLARAIEDAGIERAKAERVASAIVDLIHDEVATKADLKALELTLKADLKADIAAVRANADLIEHRLLTRLGGLMIVVGGALFAALHYWPPGHGP